MKNEIEVHLTIKEYGATGEKWRFSLWQDYRGYGVQTKYYRIYSSKKSAIAAGKRFAEKQGWRVIN